MRLLTTLLITSSLLAGCGLKRPAIRLEIVNADAHKRCGYNLHDDYDDNGNIIAGHAAKCFPTPDLKALDKSLVIDSDDPSTSPSHYQDSLALLKGYLKNLREAYDKNCKPFAGAAE